MTEEQAITETKALFGEDSFTEHENHHGVEQYYVGALPSTPGPYQGFMGLSWEQALEFAKASPADFSTWDKK